MNQERMMSVEEDTNSAIMHPSNHHKTIQFKLDDDIVAPPEKQSKKSVRKHRHIQIQDPPKQQLQESLPSKPARLDLDTNYYNNSRNEMTISPGEPSGDDNDEDDDERGERRTHLVGRAWDRLNRKRQWLMRRLSSGWMSGSPSTGGSVSSGSDVSVSTLHLFRYASSRERTAVIIGIMLMWYAASWQPISVFILATMAALMGHYTKHTSWALEHLNASEELSHVNWMAMPSFVDNSNIEPTTTAPLDQILPAPTSSTTAPSMELQNLEETGQQTPLPVHVPASDYDSFNLMGPLQTFLSSLFGFDLEAQHGITVDEILARESREFLRESFEINGAAFLLALTQLLAFFIGTTLITWAARRQASHVKLLYYRSCLSQEMSWFEGVDSAGGGSGSSLNALVDKYEDGIGMKLSLLCYFLGHVALFTLTAFYHLAEMAMFCMPFVLAVWLVVIYLSEWQAVAIGQQAVFAKRSLQLAEEILAAIRTVFAFNGQQKELARYSLSLSPFYRKSIIRHLYTALNTSLSKFSIFACFAAYCFYAMRLFPPYAAQAPSNKAAVLAVLRGAEVSIVNILISIPFMEALQQARGSIARIYSAIERRSRIDPDAEGAGLRPADWEPSISFRAVQFSYTDRAYLTKHRATLPIISLMGSPWLDNNPNGPQHPQQQRRRPPFGTRKKPRRLDAKKLAAIGSTYTPCKRVLNHFSLDVKAGQSIALVGPSGSGKSTLLALVQRLYDVGSGRILVGKHDIRDLSVAWLRNQIAVVSQEPSLFDMSIEDNIRLGMSSDDEAAAAGEDDIGQQVIEAAQAAGAHDFITRLPEGYATRVGSAGVQLSGGQKQRIAIARALIRKPKILLLDEPTSALDTESEAQVQVALRAASVGRTTLTVAHRLSTVQHADLIVVVNEGQVVECGKHDKLMAKPKSLYRQLYAEQQQAAAGSGGRTNDAAKTEWTWPEGDDTSSCSSSTSSSCGFSVNSDKQAEMSSDDSASQVSSSSTAQTNRLELDENARDTCSELVSDSDDSMVIDDTCETKPAGGDDKQQAPAPGFMQLWRFCEVPVASSLAVVFVCLLAGLILPLHLIAHSYLFAAFAYGEPDEIGYQLRSFGLLILSCSSLVFVISFLQVVLPGYVGEQISLRLRAKTLEALLRKPMFYFDMKANSAGSLCDRFNTHICALQSIAGTRTATMLEALATLTIGAIYGFGQNLRLSMFCLGFALLVLLTTIVESRIVQLESSLQQKFDAQLAHLMADSLSNIRTIASLNKETFFTDKFAQIIRQREVGVGRALLWFRTFLTSLKFVMPAMSWSASMYYGCHLLVAGSIDLRTIFIICPVVLFAVNDTFRALVFLPELLKVRKSLESLHSMNTEFDITPTGQPLKRNKTTEQLARFESKANSNNKWQQQPQPTARASGRIEFCSVHFAYPSRPSARVLRGLSLSIRPGESVALVGASGSGKSSSVNLLEKLYEYQAGEVKLDGRELRELDTDWVRSQIGLVSQEPVLLSYTIGDNIRYGDNSRVVSLSEVIDAAKRANIHEFIMSLPKRYDTQLHGSNHASGCQLSGGQRQRLAIARALIRRAPILVFDEATSALDARNEVQVQEALDRAREGRTNLTIAHRLACVRNADKIAVLSEGRVVELGRHDELMQLARGHYRALWQRQHQDQDLDAAGVGSRESASGEAEVAIAGHLADDRV